MTAKVKKFEKKQTDEDIKQELEEKINKAIEQQHTRIVQALEMFDNRVHASVLKWLTMNGYRAAKQALNEVEELKQDDVTPCYLATTMSEFCQEILDKSKDIQQEMRDKRYRVQIVYKDYEPIVKYENLLDGYVDEKFCLKKDITRFDAAKQILVIDACQQFYDMIAEFVNFYVSTQADIEKMQDEVKKYADDTQIL